MTSLTFDLTSDQEKLKNKRGGKGKNLQESNRGGPLSCVQMKSVTI